MIALDTNVLVRYFARDEPKQTERAAGLLESELTERDPGFVSTVALVELAWVLRDSYKVGERGLAEIIGKLRSAPNIVLEREEDIAAALSTPGGNFTDKFLHRLGASAGCAATYTFDRRFARLNGVTLLGVD